MKLPTVRAITENTDIIYIKMTKRSYLFD